MSIRTHPRNHPTKLTTFRPGVMGGANARRTAMFVNPNSILTLDGIAKCYPVTGSERPPMVVMDGSASSNMPGGRQPRGAIESADHMASTHSRTRGNRPRGRANSKGY